MEHENQPSRTLPPVLKLAKLQNASVICSSCSWKLIYWFHCMARLSRPEPTVQCCTHHSLSVNSMCTLAKLHIMQCCALCIVCTRFLLRVCNWDNNSEERTSFSHNSIDNTVHMNVVMVLVNVVMVLLTTQWLNVVKVLLQAMWTWTQAREIQSSQSLTHWTKLFWQQMPEDL